MDRRAFLSAGSTALFAGLATPADAKILLADLRGSVDATRLGLRPGAVDDQSQTLQRALDHAALSKRPLFLPPGRYVVSNLTLKSGAHIRGVPGATRLVYTGKGHMIIAENADSLHLEGLVIDGANRPLGDYAPSLVHFRAVKALTIRDCHVLGSTRTGIKLERCGGRITQNLVTGAKEAGIHANSSTGMTITDNDVKDCANNGILVWRWNTGEDGTIVMGNRISGIDFKDGGNGQNGNGINIFRANSVLVANNRIADCAFSAIRNNAGSNCQILGNSCSRLGETAIYSEFGYQGSIISNNVIDDATIGISITNFDHGGRLAVCSGNMVRNIRARSRNNPDSRGTGIGVEADVSLTGNVIEGGKGIGLAIGWGKYLRDVSATSNIVRDLSIGIGVSVVAGAGRATLSDNIVTGAKVASIAGMEWETVAVKDLVRRANAYPHIVLRGNQTL